MSRCGSFTLSPAGPYRSGSFVTLALTYTAGPAGLRAGGMVKLALPNNGWGEPLPPYPRECPELRRGEARQMAGWARCNTTWRLETEGGGRSAGDPGAPDTEARPPELLVYHRNSQNIIGRYDNWSWWITAVVESGSLA